ncbi:UvrD-helicase domain-containing protein [Ectobacillus polymachus]|uniref:UvrD-helicase domain-containing protein n=1 Tax=Ectobacillus polymachus TaxID=1508806 RepID=UPI003A88C188
MTNMVKDQAARNQIQQELTTNFLVEAGAGSGKTTSLVERMVQLVYSGICTIDQIVAITFTVKAADELKVRFQSKLEQTWKNETDGAVKIRLAAAMQNIEQCFLGTVHSFCARLLRERPVEAHLDLAFSEIKEEDDITLLEEAWHVYLQRLQNEQAPILQTMNELSISMKTLFENLKEMKDYSDVMWVREEVANPELLPAFQNLMQLAREAKGSIPEKQPDKGYDTLQNAIINACKKERYLNLEHDAALIDVFEEFNKNLKITQNRWNSKEDAKFYAGKISDFVETTIKPLLQQWKEYCYPTILSFLTGALETYVHMKRERSLLNFQDLLLHAARLLRDHAEVRQYFQEKYRTILVDEFQDTDPIQAEIMFYLTSSNVTEKVWTKCKPKAGSLFVVGDPKQAIYRFRRADMDTYNRVKELLMKHGGKVLQLTMNFRTVDTVTRELNRIFSQYLPDEETMYQATYHPLDSFQEDTHKELSGIRKLTVGAKKKDEVISEDAEKIATVIQELIQQGYKPSDFMVLTRYTDGLPMYAKSIESRGIPVNISGEVILGEIQEFYEFLTLLKTFVDPTDQVALLATLRGTFFGMSDEELYAWKRSGGFFSIYQECPKTLSEAMKVKWELTIDTLKTYEKWARTLSPVNAIELIIEDAGFYALLMKNGRGKQEYHSLLQILEMLRKQEMEGSATFKEAFELIQKLINEKTTVLNIEEDADAVRVMNIHKAKGLEARIVFLAHPAKVVDHKPFRHIKREDDISKGYISFTKNKGPHIRNEISFPLNWPAYQEEEGHYVEAEELRILYVAATRAEKVLFISEGSDKKKNPWQKLLDLLDIEEYVPGMDEVAASYETEIISAHEYTNSTSNLLSWLQNRKEKSFEQWSPTKNKDYAKAALIEREEGGGLAWGTLIHHVYEKIVKGADVTNIPQLLKHYGLPAEREADVREAITILTGSNLWQKLHTAELVLTEVPILLNVTKDHPLYAKVDTSEGVCPSYHVNGVIDLIYKQGGAWHIVDYKTDQPTDAGQFETLRTFYQDQIDFYKQAWEEMTGETVESSELFFVREEGSR